MTKARPESSSTLARKIREEIADRGLSAHAVAVAAGVAPSIVQRLVTGVREDIRLGTASRICAALGLRLVPAAGRRSPSRRPQREEREDREAEKTGEREKERERERVPDPDPEPRSSPFLS